METGLGSIASTSIALIFVSSLLLLIGRRQGLAKPVMLAFLLQLFLGFGLLLTLGLRADALTYHFAAVAQSQLWEGTEPATTTSGAFGLAMSSGKQLFTWILGGLYLVFGVNSGLGIVFNAFLMGLVVILLANATASFGCPAARSHAAVISALIPPFLYWAPYVSREAINFFLLSVVVLAASLVYRNRLTTGLPLFFGAFALLAFSRGQLTIVVFASLVSAFLLSPKSLIRCRTCFKTPKFWILTMSVVVMGFAEWTRWANYWSPRVKSIPDTVAANSSPGHGLGIQRVNPGNDFSVPAPAASGSESSSTFLDLALTLWGPFPWQWLDIKWAIAGMDGLGYLTLWIFVVVVFLRLPSYRWQVTVLTLALTPLILGTSLTLANYGIVMRVRAHFLPFMIPVIAIGIAHYLPSARSTSAKIRDWFRASKSC